MGKLIPKSRLHITYRTRIDGTTVPKKLPLRLLVLGDFYGGHPSPLREDLPTDLWSVSVQQSLADREIKSLADGVKLTSFMGEMQVMIPIEHRKLEATLFGKLSAPMQLKVKRNNDDGTAVIGFRGVGKVWGDKNINDNQSGAFSGGVFIEGEASGSRVPVDSADPSKGFREGIYKLEPGKFEAMGVVNGDVTGRVGPRKWRDDTTPTGYQTQNLNATFTADAASAWTGAGDDGVYVEFDDRGRATGTLVDEVVPVYLTIHANEPHCFRPDHVAKQIPEVHRLLVIKELLAEIRSHIANNYVFGDAVRSSLQRERAEPGKEAEADAAWAAKVAGIKELTTWLKGAYPQLAITPLPPEKKIEPKDEPENEPETEPETEPESPPT